MTTDKSVAMTQSDKGYTNHCNIRIILVGLTSTCLFHKKRLRLRIYDVLASRQGHAPTCLSPTATLPYLTVDQGRKAVDRVSEDGLVRGDDRALDQVLLRVVSYLIQRQESRRIGLVVAETGRWKEGRKDEHAGGGGGG